MKPSREAFKIKLFADGAEIQGMLEMASKSYISGLTTNPTLMRKAGITDYKDFATKVLTQIKEKPISFEVFSDDLNEMTRQALVISKWGQNVYVKIPITNNIGVSTIPVIEFLVHRNVKVNITAVMTVTQIEEIGKVLNPSVPSYLSVFAGRIADTGRDPIPFVKRAIEILKENKNAEVIWASPRELLNVIQAEEVGCHIITATRDILDKLQLIGKDLTEYSLETVEMFSNDSRIAGYNL
jgi:transaldolase